MREGWLRAAPFFCPRDIKEKKPQSRKDTENNLCKTKS